MQRFKYVGLKKDGERAFMDKTGIEWMPGSEHEVKDPAVVEEMKKHPTIWEPVAGAPLAAAKTPAKADKASQPQLPAWAHTGIELGASDEQLEAIAKAGGPETPEGAALWRDATGTDWQPAGTGSTDPLAGMDDAAVRAFAKERGLKVQGVGLLKGDKLRAKVAAALAEKQ